LFLGDICGCNPHAFGLERFDSSNRYHDSSCSIHAMHALKEVIGMAY